MATNEVQQTTDTGSPGAVASGRELWYGTSGPRDAEIVIIGEAWGADEDIAQRPFVGMSGNELTRILAEAGIDRNTVLMTNVVAARPLSNDMWRFFDAKAEAGKVGEVRGLHPSQFVLDELERLYAQIRACSRKIIICVGNYSLWALTKNTGYATSAETQGRTVPSGIMDWRGSMIYSDPEICDVEIPLLPIIHPAAILRQWPLRAITVHDLKARVPMALRMDWRPNPAPIFWAPPTFKQAKTRLEYWISEADAGRKFRLVCDIETARRLITTIGFADSVNFAMSIPFVRKVEGTTNLTDYWPLDQEVVLLSLMRKILMHPNIELEGQNFLYDIQYLQHYMLVKIKLSFDTMLAHHLLWPGTPKRLDYIASLYCRYYWYWKDDGKEWDLKGTLEDLLNYNCMDCIRQFESGTMLRGLIPQLKQDEQWVETLERHELALDMMNRGVRIDLARRSKLSTELFETLTSIYRELEFIIPQSMVDPKAKTPWYRSPSQQKILFGDILGMRVPRHRKTGKPTLGKDAIIDLPKKHPEFTGLFSRLKMARSVAVFRSHFVEAALDPDMRMRCFFGPAGTETFRWNSSANAFGRGTNLQNIPQGEEE